MSTIWHTGCLTVTKEKQLSNESEDRGSKFYNSHVYTHVHTQSSQKESQVSVELKSQCVLNSSYCDVYVMKFGKNK